MTDPTDLRSIAEASVALADDVVDVGCRLEELLARFVELQEAVAIHFDDGVMSDELAAWNGHVNDLSKINLAGDAFLAIGDRICEVVDLPPRAFAKEHEAAANLFLMISEAQDRERELRADVARLLDGMAG